jgi:hypothetical protein
MASDELLDVPPGDTFLLLGVVFEPSRLGRVPEHQLTGIHDASEALKSLSPGQRPEPRNLVEDHLGLTRELDREVHRRLLNRGHLSRIRADRLLRRRSESERALVTIVEPSELQRVAGDAHRDAASLGRTFGRIGALTPSGRS